MQNPSFRTRFVLIQTSHAGNVGAAARAIKVMGFDALVLVQPRWPNVLRREETIQRASGALDVLENARIVETLDEALEGMTHLCATAMTPRDFGPPTRAPREHFAQLARSATPDAGAQGVAFLFGSERFGMRNEDVYRCHACLSIPTNPKFGSLNLASALQVIAYEWRLALGGFPVQEATAPVVRADAPGAGAGRGRLSRSGRAQEAHAAAQRAVQPGRPDAGGNPYPQRCRQGHARDGGPGKAINWPYVCPSPLRHPVHP
jgi:tRNA/rRNA methyltransferase